MTEAQTHRGEGHGRELRPVAEEGRGRACLGEHVAGHPVQVQQGHPDPRGIPYGRQGMGDDPARDAHFVDRLIRLEFHHANNYTGITLPVRWRGRGYDGPMVRTPLTPEERERGERLGALLREARGGRSMVDVAASAGLSAETLRKIETGRAPTPAFFTVAALAQALGLSLDDVMRRSTLVPA